jgi:deazaflavin-dependent oxidoreductase (nitroreductase family)
VQWKAHDSHATTIPPRPARHIRESAVPRCGIPEAEPASRRSRNAATGGRVRHFMPLEGTKVLSPVGWVREQTEKILESGTTDGVHIQGRDVVLVTIRGAKSGNLRYVPLMRVEHDGVYAIVASIGGAPKHPTWYGNVKAEPHVELQDGTTTREYVAREVTGDEKAIWWERAVAAYPSYADYQAKTERVIPVLVLEPID